MPDLIVVLRWYAILGTGLSLSLAVWLIGTRGRRQSHAHRLPLRRVVRVEEPLLSQLWRFITVLAGARGVGAFIGSFSAFERDNLNQLTRKARYPWGMRSANDVYAVGLTAALIVQLTITYLANFNPLVIAIIPLSIMIGLGIPVLSLKLYAAGIRQAMIRELWTLMSNLEVYLAAGHTLYDALKEAAAACPLLSENLDRALLKWGAVGPADALDELSRDLHLPEAFMVIGAIRQAVDQDPATLALFMLRESTRLDKAMEAAQARSAQIKPMLQSALLILPAFNIFLLMTAPWAYAVYVQLQAGLGR